MITVDSRSPLGIKEKYLLNTVSTRQMLQMNATRDMKDMRIIVINEPCRRSQTPAVVAITNG